MDDSVVYFGKSKLGAIFSKPRRFFYQHEWRFAWLPPITPKIHIEPITICIGNIEIIENQSHAKNNT